MKLRSLLLCVLFIMGTAGQVYGQGGGSGTILGTVTDTTGGVIANAKVDVTNIATGKRDAHSASAAIPTDLIFIAVPPSRDQRRIMACAVGYHCVNEPSTQ